MIKTLRIASIVVSVLVAVVIIFPAVSGGRTDKQVAEFLSIPGAVEKFKENKGGKGKKAEEQVSPLVKQAEAFALYLNPPKPIPKEHEEGEKNIPRPAVVITPKFKLIGTSFYPLHPELSLALIDEPGKGLNWVRPSSEIGHLVIEQIKDGSVIVRDGQETFELLAGSEAERPEKAGIPIETSGVSASDSALPTSIESTAGVVAHSTPPPSEAEAALMEKLVSEMRALEEGGKGSQNDEEKAAMIEKLVSQLGKVQGKTESGKIDANSGDKAARGFEAMRVNAEEANKLGRLGKGLTENQHDPNKAKSRVIRKRPVKKSTGTGG